MIGSVGRFGICHLPVAAPAACRKKQIAFQCVSIRIASDLRVLACYVEWHIGGKLKPMLFDDEDAQGTEARLPSVVAPAKVSMSAQAKAAEKRTPDGDPVHSLRTLIDNLASITRNTAAPRLPGAEPFQVVTWPTPLRRKALEHLVVRLQRS